MIVVTIIGIGVVYFAPTWIAALRDHNTSGVAVVNTLLGWSIVGWVIALVMACGNEPQPAPRFDSQTGKQLGP